MLSKLYTHSQVINEITSERAYTVEELTYIKDGKEISIPGGSVVQVDAANNIALFENTYFSIYNGEYRLLHH